MIELNIPPTANDLIPKKMKVKSNIRTKHNRIRAIVSKLGEIPSISKLI